MNWVKDHLSRNPELARLPVYKRDRHSLHMRQRDGSVIAEFSTRPMHFQNARGIWKPIDTMLKAISGGYGSAGSDVLIGQDGDVQLLGTRHRQRTGRFVVLDTRTGAVASVLAEFGGPLRTEASEAILEAGTYQHRLHVTPTGLREELTITERLSGSSAAEWAMLETEIQGRTLKDGWLDSLNWAGKYRFHAPICTDANGKQIAARWYAKREGGKQYLYTGVPLAWLSAAAYPVVLDPDFSSGADDGYVASATTYTSYADARATAAGAYTANVLIVGQRYVISKTPYWTVNRGFLLFNTASIGSASILAANLKLWTEASSNPLLVADIEITQLDWSAWKPITSGNMEAVYDAALAAPLDCNWQAAGATLSQSTAYESAALDADWINRTGYTYYGLLSQNDRDGVDPNGTSEDYVSLQSSEGTHPPTLRVIYGTPASLVGATFEDLVEAVDAVSLGAADVRTAIGLGTANLDTQLGIIAADTNELQTDWHDGGRLDVLLDAAGGGGTSEPAQLDWRAWETPSGALKDLYDDNAIDVLDDTPSAWDAGGAEYFGSYAMCEFDGSLFIGLSNTPMNGTGAIVVRLDTPGGAPVFEYNMPEEGIMRMAANPAGTALYATGVDVRDNTERCGFYKRDLAGAWTRRSTLRLFPSEDGYQHILDIAFVGSRIYICGQGWNTTTAWSDDDGLTWTYGSWVTGRAFAIRPVGTTLVMLGSADAVTDYAFSYSVNGGLNWLASILGTPLTVNGFVNWGDLIACGVGTTEIITFDEAATVVRYALPFNLRQVYNNLVVDTDGYLCALGSTGVWRTNDLATWKQVWSFAPGDTIRSLATWGDSLVVSTSGATAAILSRPASPEAAQQQMYRDALKLAASPGTAATGSTDADIADILTDTAAIKVITDAIDVSAVTLATGNVAGDLTFIVGATFDETLTGLTIIPSDWTKCYFSLKREKDSDSDSASLVQIKVTNGGDASDGLLYVQGFAPVSPVTKASASLTVTQSAGTVRIAISAAALALLTGGLSSLDWDLKVFKTGGWSKVVTSGAAEIAWTPTRAV